MNDHQVTYWLQNSDLSIVEDNIQVHSTDQIMSVIQSNNWAAQNSYEDASPIKGRECCPAGIGLVSDTGNILHICPKVAANEMMIHLHQPIARIILGIFKSANTKVFSFAKVPTSQTGWIIQTYLGNKIEDIKKSLEGYRI